MKTLKDILLEKLVRINHHTDKVVNDKGKEIGRIGQNYDHFITSRKKGTLKVKMKHKTKDAAIDHLKKSVSEGTTDYEAHNDFGSPKKKVLTRKSPSSSGDEE